MEYPKTLLKRTFKEWIPVRLRSRSSMVVMDWRAFAPSERNSSSSASTPAAMAPPSARFTGGSGKRVRSSLSRRSSKQVQAHRALDANAGRPVF